MSKLEMRTLAQFSPFDRPRQSQIHKIDSQTGDL